MSTRYFRQLIEIFKVSSFPSTILQLQVVGFRNILYLSVDHLTFYAHSEDYTVQNIPLSLKIIFTVYVKISCKQFQQRVVSKIALVLSTASLERILLILHQPFILNTELGCFRCVFICIYACMYVCLYVCMYACM